MRPRPIEQLAHALLASKLHVGAGRDHAIEHVLGLADQRYVLGAVVVLQPVDVVEQHEVLRLFALSAVIAVAAAVAHTNPAEQLPNVALLFARQRVQLRNRPGRPRRPSGTACGQERPGAASSFDADRASFDTDHASFDADRGAKFPQKSGTIPFRFNSQMLLSETQPADLISEPLQFVSQKAHVAESGKTSETGGV